MNIYVGRLPYSVTNDDLRDMFEKYGTVDSAVIIKEKQDRSGGDDSYGQGGGGAPRSKGFGFVEMSNDTEAEAAIEALNGSSLNDDRGIDRQIIVNVAKPREDSRGSGSGRGNTSFRPSRNGGDSFRGR